FAGARCIANLLHGRPDVGVVPRTDVMEINQQHVDGVDSRGRGSTRSAIETVDWKTADGIPAVGKSGTIFGAAKAVLGTEQNRKPCAVSRAQEIHISTTKAINAGAIRPQAAALAGNQVCRIGQQDFDAWPHLGGGR